MSHLHRKTKRLEIRPRKLSDYSAWKVARTTMLPLKNKWDQGNKQEKEVSLASYKKTLKALNKLQDNDKHYDFAIFERKSGKLIGMVVAMEVSRGVSQSAFLGYRIYNNFWGKGYAKEAVKAMFDIAFRDLKLHRLEAGIEPQNRRSILLARSLKLRKEGLKKKALFLRGEWVDLVMYSTTCEDFGLSYKWKKVPKTLSR